MSQNDQQSKYDRKERKLAVMSLDEIDNPDGTNQTSSNFDENDVEYKSSQWSDNTICAYNRPLKSQSGNHYLGRESQLSKQKIVIMHDMIFKKLNVRICPQEENTNVHQNAHYSDVSAYSIFLKNHAKQISIIDDAFSDHGEVTKNIAGCGYTVSSKAQQEGREVLHFKLLEPSCFVWLIRIDLQQDRFKILYPPSRVQFILKRGKQSRDYDYISEVFPVCNTPHPQYFTIQDMVPCVQYIDVVFINYKQVNPEATQYQIKIENIDIKGVQLNYLAAELMKARQNGRISSRITSGSVFMYTADYLNLLQIKKNETCLQLINNNKYTVKNVMTSVYALQRTIDTVELISTQHQLRHNYLEDAHKAAQDILKCSGNSLQRRQNDEFFNKWC